jgi:hypothetical protein
MPVSDLRHRHGAEASLAHELHRRLLNRFTYFVAVTLDGLGPELWHRVNYTRCI